jgi:hypothetical protein
VPLFAQSPDFGFTLFEQFLNFLFLVVGKFQTAHHTGKSPTGSAPRRAAAVAVARPVAASAPVAAVLGAILSLILVLVGFLSQGQTRRQQGQPQGPDETFESEHQSTPSREALVTRLIEFLQN